MADKNAIASPALISTLTLLSLVFMAVSFVCYALVAMGTDILSVRNRPKVVVDRGQKFILNQSLTYGLWTLCEDISMNAWHLHWTSDPEVRTECSSWSDLLDSSLPGEWTGVEDYLYLVRGAVCLNLLLYACFFFTLLPAFHDSSGMILQLTVCISGCLSIIGVSTSTLVQALYNKFKVAGNIGSHTEYSPGYVLIMAWTALCFGLSGLMLGFFAIQIHNYQRYQYYTGSILLPRDDSNEEKRVVKRVPIFNRERVSMEDDESSESFTEAEVPPFLQ